MSDYYDCPNCGIRHPFGMLCVTMSADVAAHSTVALRGELSTALARIAELERELAEARERITDLCGPPWHFRCPECGPHVAGDEDGCCATCGADCSAEACDCVDLWRHACLAACKRAERWRINAHSAWRENSDMKNAATEIRWYYWRKRAGEMTDDWRSERDRADRAEAERDAERRLAEEAERLALALADNFNRHCPAPSATQRDAIAAMRARQERKGGGK